jgi:hypothetical protein
MAFLKKILFLTTGGTISCQVTDDGLEPTLSGNDILNAVPELRRLGDITVQDLTLVDSSNIHPARAGVDVLDVDVASMALGTSHPAAESMLESLKSTTRAPRMNQSVLAEINAHFARIRPKYEEYLSKFTGVNIGVLRHQIPGGMLSNLENQLKQMNMADRRSSSWRMRIISDI